MQSNTRHAKDSKDNSNEIELRRSWAHKMFKKYIYTVDFNLSKDKISYQAWHETKGTKGRSELINEFKNLCKQKKLSETTEGFNSFVLSKSAVVMSMEISLHRRMNYKENHQFLHILLEKFQQLIYFKCYIKLKTSQQQLWDYSWHMGLDKTLRGFCLKLLWGV